MSNNTDLHYLYMKVMLTSNIRHRMKNGICNSVIYISIWGPGMLSGSPPIAVACPGIRKGGGGGENLKGFFFAFQFFEGGPSSENSRENDISD